MRRFAATIGVVISVLVLGALLLLPTGTTGAAASRLGPTTKSAHVAFEDCPAATTVLTVSIPRLSYSARQAVNVTVTLTNTRATACGESSTSPPPAQVQNQLNVGPCGQLGLEIFNAKGANVYPGNVALHCPAEFGVELPAHSRLRATSSWNQQASYNSTALAPRGAYRLGVSLQLGRAARPPFSFQIRLIGSAKGPLPLTTLPPQSTGPVTVCPEPGPTVPPTPSCAGLVPALPQSPTGGAMPLTPCQGTSATLISATGIALAAPLAVAAQVSAACPTPVVVPRQETIPTIPSR
jgi:hypothetical protein